MDNRRWTTDNGQPTMDNRQWTTDCRQKLINCVKFFLKICIIPFKFEKLEIWQLAVDMANKIHLLTRNFPKEEMFSLTSQMKRAADSVALNIAEGSTGQSNPEQRKFIGYAQRSALEVVTCIFLSKRRDYIDEKIFQIFYSELDKLVAKIQSFKNTLN